VPVEVVLDFALLALDEPVALPESVVANLLAKVEGLQELLRFQVLLVPTNVHDHGNIALVAIYHSEKLLVASESLFGVLIKPFSFTLEIAQLAGMLLRIFLKSPLKAHIRVNENPRTLCRVVSHRIWHTVLLN